jgi:tRNA G18 (ribose-2'-O)-methylase SpoU
MGKPLLPISGIVCNLLPSKMKQRIRTSGINYPEVSGEDKPWNLWERNVKDEYKSFSTEEIKNDLKKTALPSAVLMSQISGDFNFSCIIRTVNNFNLSAVYYFGNKRYDKRGAQGTYHYSDVVFLPTLDDIIALKQQYKFIGLENNITDTVPIKDFVWPPNSLIVLGEEGSGIAQELINLLDYKVEILSRGSVRSINVASAAAIAIYDLVSKTL